MGRAIALRLAREGARLVICDIDEKNAEETATSIREFGSEVLVVKCDASKGTDAKRAIQETVSRFSKIDILINNVGIGYATGSITDPSHVLIENLTEQEWDKVMSINLKSMFLFSKEVAPYMKKQHWGKIVSISSTAAFTGHGLSGGSGPAYGVSKAGMINLTKTLAQQLGPYNVNVNCIAPGSVPETAFRMSDQEIRKEEATLPLRRLGKTTNIADAVAFLCSDAAEWITGQTISVNGGETM